MKRRTLLGLTGALLAGCANLGTPDIGHVSEAQLVRALARAFPAQRRILDVLEVSASAPRLRLMPQANRLALGLDLSASERLSGRQLTGQLEFDAVPRWDAADQSLRLTDVRVTRLALDGLGARVSAERLAVPLAERLLEGLVLHRLTPDQQQRLAQAGLRPAGVQVVDGGVQVQLQR